MMSEFPIHMLQNCEQRDLDALGDESKCGATMLTAQLDIGIQVTTSPKPFRYRPNHMMLGGLARQRYYMIGLWGCFTGIGDYSIGCYEAYWPGHT
jgi:hypothetical protein